MAPCVYTNEDNILYTKDMENMKINNIFINSNTFSYYITILNSFLTFFLVIHLHFHNVYFLKTLITTNNVMEKGLALVPVPVTIAVKNLTQAFLEKNVMTNLIIIVVDIIEIHTCLISLKTFYTILFFIISLSSAPSETF